MRKKYDRSGNPLTPEFTTCIALLKGAKNCARWRTSDSSGISLLEKGLEQELMDAATSAINQAVQHLEALQGVLKR